MKLLEKFRVIIFISARRELKKLEFCMKNNVDFGFRFEDMDDSSFCQQKPYSCTAGYYTVYLTVLYSWKC